MRVALAIGVVGLLCASVPASAASRYAQYYPPAPAPPHARPPCYTVTPGPFAGAARGAAAGAIGGAIFGRAGRGAAIGATVGGVAGVVRHGTARAYGACY